MPARKNLYLLLIVCVFVFSAVNRSIAAEPVSNRLQHAILVNVNSRKITRSDLDEMGLILFRLSFPDRPLDSITAQEVDMLSANALRELIIINLLEDEMNILKSSSNPMDKIEIRSNDINDHIDAIGLEKLSHKKYTRRFAASQLIMNDVIGRSGKTASPSPRSVINFYRQHKNDVFVTKREVKIRHIFLPESALNPQTLKKQAGMIFSDLKKLSPEKRLQIFPRKAKEFSKGRFRKSGGLLMGDFNGGWFSQEEDFKLPNGKTLFPEEMIKGIRKLTTPGQIIMEKSNAGWHILMLEDIHGGTPISFSKSRRFIGDFLQQRQMASFKQCWLRNKIARSTIIWNNGEKFDVSKLLTTDSEENQLRYLSMRIRMAMQKPQKHN